MALSQLAKMISSLMGDEDGDEDWRRKKIRHTMPEGTILSRQLLGVEDRKPKTFTPRPEIQNNQLTSELGINRLVDGSIQGAYSLPYDVFGGLMEQKRRDGAGPISSFIQGAFGIPAAAFSPRIFENEKAMDDMMSAFSTKGSPIYGDVDAARAQFDAMQVKRADKGRDPITRVRNKGYNPGETPAPRFNNNVPAPGQKMTPKAVSYMGVGTKPR